ncbi:MAG TPA: spore coat U domain-containing protein [Terracidiphilus sp.]|nr:spore coat U domain-containing protein [Terracidiphilus sp.]
MKYTHVKSATVAAAVLGFALAFAPASASASTTTATFAVSTTVTNSCTISAAALAFSAYTGVVDQAQTTLTVKCTNNGDYTVALNGGATTGGTVTTRLMANGTYTLGYSLFTSNTYGTVWGDGTGSTVTQSGVGTGANQTLTVYGQIPANETAISGTYTDTITATITY